jgi:hypothetical protein
VEDIVNTSDNVDGIETADKKMYDSDDSAEDEDHGKDDGTKKIRG